MPFDSETVSVTSEGDSEWILNRALTYEGRQQRFTVPRDFSTDFATIPAVLTWLVKRTGSHTRAVILHDWLVSEGVKTGQVSHNDADGILRRALRETGTPVVRRWLMWTGVRYGSLKSGRRNGWLRDLPAVAAITVLSLPFVAPPALLAVVGYCVYWLLEKLAGLVSR